MGGSVTLQQAGKKDACRVHRKEVDGYVNCCMETSCAQEEAMRGDTDAAEGKRRKDMPNLAEGFDPDIWGARADRDTFSIRDLTREFDVTARTLRFYEERGLLSPRREGQERVYGRRDRARL